MALIGADHPEVMPSGDEFPQQIRGNWKRSSSPFKRETIELELRGRWRQKNGRTWTAYLNGRGNVGGLSSDCIVDGVLTLTLPLGKCEVRIEFSDPHGTKYIIEAATPFIVAGAVGARLKGDLSRGKSIVGDVEIDINWAPFREAAASLWSTFWK